MNPPRVPLIFAGKYFQNSLFPKFEDSSHLCPYPRESYFSERRQRQRIAHLITHQRFASWKFFKTVVMDPDPVRPLQLFVNKLQRRIPLHNSSFPTHRKAVQLDPIINQCSLLHGEGRLRQNAKIKRCRSESGQVAGIREKQKDPIACGWHDRFCFKKMFKQNKNPI